MKKTILIAMLMIFSLSVFCACDTNNHTHDYQNLWHYSQTQHWHECECGKISELQFHEFEEIKNNNLIKEQPTTTKPAVYFKSCQCGFVSNETFYGDRLPNENDGKSFKVDLNSNLELNDLNILYESSYDNVLLIFNDGLNQCSYNSLYSNLNNISGTICCKKNNSWEFTEWAKGILFTDNKWTYSNNLTIYSNTNFILYTETTGISEFYAYKDVTYNFCFNYNVDKNCIFNITVLNQINNIPEYNLMVYDKDFNSIEFTKVGAENTFTANSKFYFSITFKESQNISIISSISAGTASLQGGHSNNRTLSVDMINNKIYTLKVSISDGSVKFQILQTTGEIIKFLDSKGNIYNLEQGNNNPILTMPAGQYIFYIKCSQMSSTYTINVRSGSFIIE